MFVCLYVCLCVYLCVYVCVYVCVYMSNKAVQLQVRAADAAPQCEDALQLRQPNEGQKHGSGCTSLQRGNQASVLCYQQLKCRL